MSLTQVKEQIVEMTPEERAELRDFLDGLNDDNYNRHWGEITAKRLENLRSGKTKGIPLEDVLNET